MKNQKDQFDLYLQDTEEDPERLQNIVPDKKLNKAFIGTTYDKDSYREYIKYALLKRACDLYICGSMDRILIDLDLSYKNGNLTRFGKIYMWNAFKDDKYDV